MYFAACYLPRLERQTKSNSLVFLDFSRWLCLLENNHIWKETTGKRGGKEETSELNYYRVGRNLHHCMGFVVRQQKPSKFASSLACF